MSYMTWKLSSMFSTLDYPGNIARMLQVARRSKPEQNRATRQREATQEDDQSRDHETDVDEWIVFCHIFQKDLKNTSLLATVLLTANFSFLAIPSIDQNGLSYWPQRLSYASLLFAMGSVLVGLAVRCPRFSTPQSKLNVEVALAYPFLLFLYSVYFFIAALIVHFALHSAIFQYSAAILIFSLISMYLYSYWLATDPQGQLICSWIAGTLDRDLETATAN
ncbi:hypothetical protein EV401DRAFT_237275 [Pisolithus croceorrhizus]|nr:hypothetical protein EV401DRAFT_237275 [Pisolithus croceorrhizus]